MQYFPLFIKDQDGSHFFLQWCPLLSNFAVQITFQRFSRRSLQTAVLLIKFLNTKIMVVGSSLLATCIPNALWRIPLTIFFQHYVLYGIFPPRAGTYFVLYYCDPRFAVIEPSSHLCFTVYWPQMYISSYCNKYLYIEMWSIRWMHVKGKCGSNCDVFHWLFCLVQPVMGVLIGIFQW